MPSPSRRLPLLAAAGLCSLVLAPVTHGLPATTTVSPHPKERGLSLSVLGTYRSGSFDAGASEIVAYDAKTYRAFAVNADDGTVDVLDISDPTSPTKVASLAAPGANNVAVERGLVAVAQEAETTTDLGTVSFFDAST